VVDEDTLKRAMAESESYKSLIVRLVCCSDYFCDLGEELQKQTIACTEQGSR
jgi:pyruvate-formate lyase